MLTLCLYALLALFPVQTTDCGCEIFNGVPVCQPCAPPQDDPPPGETFTRTKRRAPSTPTSKKPLPLS